MSLNFDEVQTLNTLILGGAPDALSEARSYLAYCQSEYTRAEERHNWGEIDDGELTAAFEALGEAEAIYARENTCRCAAPDFVEQNREGETFLLAGRLYYEPGEAYAICLRCGREAPRPVSDFRKCDEIPF